MSRVKSDEERHAKAFFQNWRQLRGAFKEQCCCFILGGAFRGFTD